MDDAKIEKILGQIEQELTFMSTRIDMLEKSVGRMRDSSLVDSELFSKLETRVFHGDAKLCETVAATKIMQFEVEQLKKRVNELAEGAKEK